MKVLVAGGQGQVGQCLQMQAVGSRHEFIFSGRAQLDLMEADAPARVLDQVRPDLVINLAACTAVDAAEVAEAEAGAVNADGAEAVAKAAARAGAPLIHLSTDYVFSGTAGRAMHERDTPDPINAYGRSKWAGERAVAAAHAHHLILRTAWLYSPFGHNFLRTMLRLAGERAVVDVVDDQVGAPTSGRDLADGLLRLVDIIAGSTARAELAWGTYHLTAAGSTSWAGFAETIFAASKAAGGPFAEVNRVSSTAFAAPAQRPACALLDCSAIAADWQIELPNWRESVKHSVDHLLRAGEKVG